MSSNAREMIASEVFRSNSATLIYDCEGRLTDYAKPAFVADRIIDIVRESLLREEAIIAGNYMLPDYSQNTDAGDVATEMLNTAFGADETEEE